MKFLLLLLVITGFLSNANVSASQNENSTKLINSVRQLSDILSEKFSEIIVTELATEYSVHYEPRSAYKVSRPIVSDQELLNSITEKLSYKLSSAAKILKDMNNIVAKTNNTPSFTHPCPFTSIRKSVLIKGADIYISIPPTDTKSKVIGHFKDLKVKRQYFLSHIDYATDKDCSTIPQSNLRHLYHKVVHPDPKFMLFVIDTNLDAEALQYAVKVVKETIYALQNTDMIALKIMNTTDFFKFEDLCSIDGISDIGNATDGNKLLLREYLSSIETSHFSVPATTVNSELKMLLEKPNLPKSKLVITLTDTKISKNETWLKSFPSTKADSTLFALGVISDKELHKNSTFGILLFDKWHNHSSNHSVLRLHIHNSGVVGQVASAFISLVNQNYKIGELVVETPTWEPMERDFMTSIVLPTTQGILGLDLYWSDLAEDILYFKSTNIKKRIFVTDFSFNVLMHSFFPRPESASEKIKFTKIEIIENYDFIHNVKEQMLVRHAGNITFALESSNKSIIYSWKWIENIYIVCLVAELQGVYNSNNSNNLFLSRANKEILFHRLDLFPPKNGKMCRHFKQIATIDQGTVYLSPSSFQSPFTYLYDMGDGREAVTYMQNYLAYLKSLAHGLLSNPGLKNEIQNDVSFLNSILSYYKRQHLHGPNNKYVIRRYAVTESGVMVMFPGTVLEYDYEPVKRPWYNFAMENPNKIILTPPNLDSGGAGYVVSISYAVRSAFYPTMVVSMDVTMGFLYKLLIDTLPECGYSHIKCFFMNNRGYLVSHPGLMDPNRSGPIEQQHIAHKESTIATDMLNHKGFVTKRLCNNFPDKTIQRFYEFNMSLSKVLTNAVPGDHCVHYYITAIPGTNAFIGLINGSCGIGAFCPCSMKDRLCLNCNRMEQNECECPCECSSDSYSCPNTNTSSLNKDLPLCGVITENNNHKSHYFNNFAENLKPCFDFQCESYTSHSACLGVLGCEWCQLDTDGKSPLVSPFCSSQSTCFNGVLGAVTPYGEGTFGHVVRDDVLGSYSAIGPIAGCIVTVSLVIAVAIYCYRQNVTSASCHNLYVDGPAETWQDQDVQLSHLPSDDMHDHSGQDKLLPAMEIEAPISPYRVITSYRRPHTAAGSDHGYSTMTPHEDSEATGFSVNDPIVLSDDTKSDVSCPIPSKIKPRPKATNDLSVTVLPCGKNSIVAPVTVHRHMEAS